MLLYDTLDRFEKKFGYLKKKGLRINGLKMIDPKRKKHVIDVSRPLIFDNRLLPKSFEGLEVKAIIHGDLPTEFKIDRTIPDWQKKVYIWAPERVFEMCRQPRIVDGAKRRRVGRQMSIDGRSVERFSLSKWRAIVDAQARAGRRVLAFAQLKLPSWKRDLVSECSSCIVVVH